GAGCFRTLGRTPRCQALPGARFGVTGAAPPHDLALVTAGSEWRLRSNWSLMARFDGEFGEGQQTYTGTARVRYAWGVTSPGVRAFTAGFRAFAPTYSRLRARRRTSTSRCVAPRATASSVP